MVRANVHIEAVAFDPTAAKGEELAEDDVLAFLGVACLAWGHMAIVVVTESGVVHS